MAESRSADMLIEAATTAFRVRDPATGRVLPAAAWWDLAREECEGLFSRQLASRALEGAHDPAGLSSTAHAVLLSVHRTEQL